MPALSKSLLALAFTLASASAAVADDNTCSGSSNNIQGVMYFNSKPKDAAACSLSVKNGRLVFNDAVTNPGMSCPDAAAWKLFADAVKDDFWSRWATDPQTWPAKPLPLCGTSGGANCCTVGAANNPGYDTKDNPSVNCPYFPGDHLAKNTLPPLRYGVPPSKAHFNTFSHGLAMMKLASASPDADDTGRVIRQSMAELVFRNKPMFDFVFRNDVYHQNGIQQVFARNAANIKAGSMPYRVKSSTAGLTEIDFPIDAVMIKSNWIEKSRAEKLGLKDDPDAPYIKMTILTNVNDNNAPIFKPGEHWLVAFHISSKDTPNWVWATWEHVNNPGRCDYIGCNDSYGYASADKVAANQETNYTTPHTQCDHLDLASWVFRLNDKYESGPRSKNLADALNGLGIGTKAPAYGTDGPIIPKASDKGWLSYRLKGSQVDFTDSYGVPTLLGNSVTEGGFMQTSSCISCHARAGTNSAGTIPLALGVFVNTLNETGYLQSTSGTPDPNLYFASNQPPALQVLQTDFVWGFLSANCLNGANLPCTSSAVAPSFKATAPKSIEGKSIRERISNAETP